MSEMISERYKRESIARERPIAHFVKGVSGRYTRVNGVLAVGRLSDPRTHSDRITGSVHAAVTVPWSFQSGRDACF